MTEKNLHGSEFLVFPHCVNSTLISRNISQVTVNCCKTYRWHFDFFFIFLFRIFSFSFLVSLIAFCHTDLIFNCYVKCLVWFVLFSTLQVDVSIPVMQWVLCYISFVILWEWCTKWREIQIPKQRQKLTNWETWTFRIGLFLKNKSRTYKIAILTFYDLWYLIFSDFEQFSRLTFTKIKI